MAFVIFEQKICEMSFKCHTAAQKKFFILNNR